MMGLHGAFIVMPDFTQPPPGGVGNKWTPYHNPTANVQGIFNAFGNPDIWPGLAWGEPGANPAPHPPTPPFRTFIWLDHQASPNLFAEVGNYTPGADYPAVQFVDRFFNPSFNLTNDGNSYYRSPSVRPTFLPVATIHSVAPSPALQGRDIVAFRGSGQDSDEKGGAM